MSLCYITFIILIHGLNESLKKKKPRKFRKHEHKKKNIYPILQFYNIYFYIIICISTVFFNIIYICTVFFELVSLPVCTLAHNRLAARSI